MANVKFYSVKLKETYNALETKDSLSLYWIEETSELYKGSQLYGTGRISTSEFAGLMSPEDKVKLDSLVSANGLSNLTPIDGTLIITDTDDGGKSIGIAISSESGNALRKMNDGLYVQSISTANSPTYSIEKQAIAEDGYAASYRLKEVAGGTETYVGDVINIPKDMVLQSAMLETVTEKDVPYSGASIGDPYIKMVFNDTDGSCIYIPVKGLVDTYVPGNGIEIIDNKVSVKLADNAHGLTAVGGALILNLATKDSDGAMSKEDKKALDAIPSVYMARKYEISNAPKGTLINYGEKEIRIMCPANTEFVKQTVGEGGDADSYYITFKTYVPNNNVVGYIEHLGNQVDEEILTNISTDEYGRRYQPTWLAVAKYDEVTDTWTYYGKNSSTDKYIGWDYQIDWYDADGVMISTDSIRINLSNEDCHNNVKPYYVANYATTEELEAIKESVDSVEESFQWGEM